VRFSLFFLSLPLLFVMVGNALMGLGWDCRYLSETADYPVFDAILQGGLEACKLVQEQEAANLILAKLLNTAAVCYQHRGYFDKAIEHGKQSLELRRKFLEPDNDHIAGSLRRLSFFYESAGDEARFYQARRESLDILAKKEQTDERKFWTAEMDLPLIRILLRKGEVDRAEKLLQEAMRFFEGIGSDYMVSRYESLLRPHKERPFADISTECISCTATSTSPRRSMEMQTARFASQPSP
jgi:tetratricopeptide (TPR) repeat protein